MLEFSVDVNSCPPIDTRHSVHHQVELHVGFSYFMFSHEENNIIQSSVPSQCFVKNKSWYKWHHCFLGSLCKFRWVQVNLLTKCTMKLARWATAKEPECSDKITRSGPYCCSLRLTHSSWQCQIPGYKAKLSRELSSVLLISNIKEVRHLSVENSMITESCFEMRESRSLKHFYVPHCENFISNRSHERNYLFLAVCFPILYTRASSHSSIVYKKRTGQ